ncbi:MAG: NHL domain-containing protein [Bacteroidia bacterium]
MCKRILISYFLAFVFALPISGFGQIITTIAGNGTLGYGGDGGQATAADLYNLGTVAIDVSGNLYIATAAKIRMVTTAGIITDVVGNGTAGFSGDGGQATAAEINYAAGIAIDAAGNIYIADIDNQRIRKVNTSGIISTIAGNGTGGYTGDGVAATSVELNVPTGVALDAMGNLYIADDYNSRVRMVNTAGIITTVVGTGTCCANLGDGGQATDAELNGINAIIFDATGNLYIATSGRIRKVIMSTGIISTIAGNGTNGYSGDGGQATAAEFNGPTGIAFDANGNMYIGDDGDNRVRIVNTVGIISTIVGNGTSGYNGDGGQATTAELNSPWGLAFDVAGYLYIADKGNNVIRMVCYNSCSTTGIEQISIQNSEFRIYPNPTNNVINIECLMPNETTEITITDVLGNVIYHSIFTTQYNTINVADLITGIYFISIETGNGKTVKKVVKN